jgi:hypothetical protein
MTEIFISNVQKELEEKIQNVHIKVYTFSGTLYVEIITISIAKWQHRINNIQSQISQGISSRYVAELITREYKKYILSIFFK